MTLDPWRNQSSGGTDDHLLHASAVSVDGRGVIIAGASGLGKSSLAIEMIALGATLVADDAVWLTSDGDALRAHAPEKLDGRIEARGLGILQIPSAPAAIGVGVELLETPGARLPPVEKVMLCGHNIPLYRLVKGPASAAALILLLRGATRAPM